MGGCLFSLTYKRRIQKAGAWGCLFSSGLNGKKLSHSWLPSFFHVPSDKTRIYSSASLEIPPKQRFSKPLFHRAGLNKNISLARFSPPSKIIRKGGDNKIHPQKRSFKQAAIPRPLKKSCLKQHNPNKFSRCPLSLPEKKKTDRAWIFNVKNSQKSKKANKQEQTQSKMKLFGSPIDVNLISEIPASVFSYSFQSQFSYCKRNYSKQPWS